MGSLNQLRPENVWRYFEEICRIPRGSGNEGNISDFIKAFAKSKGFDALQDKANNVIVKKPATAGYEKSLPVILQAHMDMVCEKNKDVEHDFTKDPICAIIDGDMVRARGTTLGADNGIGIAYLMALLDESGISHPPLELVFTTDEETGMHGVIGLEPTLLQGKRLINLDTEEEGVFVTSCAGGMKITMHLPIQREKKGGLLYFSVQVTGLKGGHSGTDIHKGHGNSNQILGRLLEYLDHNVGLRLAYLSGGLKDNAIPREAEAIIGVLPEQELILRNHIIQMEKEIKNELRQTDPGCMIVCEKTQYDGMVWQEETKNKAISALVLTPNGVQSMSFDIPGLVETSNNLGVVYTDENEIGFVSALRSSVIGKKYFLQRRLERLSSLIGARVTLRGNYPSWEYNPDSAVRNTVCRIYREKFNREPEIQAIHAGLECGVFAEKIPGVDMISMGPDIFDAHTPKERVDIQSVARTWDFLLLILGDMK